MTNLYKLVVTDAFNAGKSTFVRTVSEFNPVDTDKSTRSLSEKKVKAATTVALDYGRMKINHRSAVHLFGTPGQDRFDFMREILAEKMHGFIFLVDSTDRCSLNQAGELLRLFQRQNNVPHLLAANKADQKGLSSEEIRRALNLPVRQPIVRCIATDKESAQAVVERLVSMIEDAA
jgi:signal recognition particle receptor subunit beta